MSIFTVKTFLDLQNAFREKAKLGNSLTSLDSDTLNKIKRFINEAYMKISYHKEWYWRLKTRYLTTVEKLTTGTVAVTNGSREVTFSVGVTVDDTFKGRTIQITSDNEWYEIIAVHDAANRKVMLSAPYIGTTNATATYQVFRNKYGLWPDCADIVSVIPMIGTVYSAHNKIDGISPSRYNELVGSMPFQTAARPVCYTIMDSEDYDGVPMGSEFIMGYDFMENDNFISVDKAMWFYPRVFDKNVLQITYGRHVEELSSDDDQPLMPKDNRIAIVYYALAQWFSTQTQNATIAGQFNMYYQDELAKMAGDFDESTELPQLIPVTRRLGGYRWRSSRYGYEDPSL